LGGERVARLGGLALPAAVWVLGMVTPPREGLTPSYVLSFTGLLVALTLVDQWLARGNVARAWQWLGLVAEVGLAYLVVQTHGTLIRPALIYLLPTSRALLVFGAQHGLAGSLLVWVGYGLNVAGYAWPDRLAEYPNYFSFFLAPYLVTVVLALAMLRQAADRERVQALYDELRRAHAELQAMHEQAQELAVTQERNRLAREIHDSLAHYLTVINLQLEAAEQLGEQDPARAQEQVRRARRLTLTSLQEVRRSVAALRATSREELSLPSALADLITEFADATGLLIQHELEATGSFPPDVALAFYRAAQEGLTNVQRHARATHAWVSLHTADGWGQLVVRDNGVAATELPTNGPDTGFGLQGLQERVALLGGEVHFTSEPGGSRLEVTAPLTDRTA
jgi:signal transduction histidine kinase